MSRSKLLVIAVISLLLINIGTLVFVSLSKPSREKHFQRPPRGEGPKQIIIDRLGFDAGQQKAYEITIDRHRQGTRELEQASRELHQQLFSLLKDKDYQQKADSLIELIAVNQKAIDHLNFAHFLEIKALCKNGQIEKFNTLAGDLAHLFSPEGPPH